MNETSPLAEFDGQARLFPLPNLVFFPQVMQPLHIFEPRYRQMTADALDGDRLIALVLPRPGWEKDYADRPAIHPVACIGKILAEQRLEDGRFNLLLRGLARIRIGKELPSDKLYRIARAEILKDTPIEDTKLASDWRRRLAARMPGWFAHKSEVVEQFRKLLDSDLSVGTLCDIMAFALPLDAEFKQSLLEELAVEPRVKMLHDFMEGKKTLASVVGRRFPPDFSIN